MSIRKTARWVLAFCLSMSGACAVDMPEEKSKTTTEPLYVRRDAIWPTHTIPVCWENPEPWNDVHRSWVRDAVQGSWSAVANVDFIGWDQKCTFGSPGVHISILDWAGGPQVSSLGRFLDGVGSGMQLNFTFKYWTARNTDCTSQTEYCVRLTAIHEF